jgi:hypothetical protein
MVEASNPPTNDPHISNANAGAADTPAAAVGVAANDAARTPTRPTPPPAIAFSSPPRGGARSGPELTSQLNSVLDNDEEELQERKRAEEAKLINKIRLILKQAEFFARITPKLDPILIPMPEDDIVEQMWIGAFKRVGRPNCIREEGLHMIRFTVTITPFDPEGVEDSYLPQRRHAPDNPSDASPRVQRSRLSEVSADDSPIFLRATSSSTTAPTPQAVSVPSTAKPTAELPSHAQYVVINESIAPPEVLDNLQLRPLFRRFVFANLDPDQMIRQEQMDKLKVYSASIHASFKNVLQDIQPVRYVSQAGLAALYADILLALNEHEVPLEQFETRVHFLALWDILLSKLPQPLADYLREKRNQMTQSIDKWSLADPWIIEKTKIFVSRRQPHSQSNFHVPRFPWKAIPRNLTSQQFAAATCVNCFEIIPARLFRGFGRYNRQPNRHYAKSVQFSSQVEIIPEALPILLNRIEIVQPIEQLNVSNAQCETPTMPGTLLFKPDSVTPLQLNVCMTLEVHPPSFIQTF